MEQLLRYFTKPVSSFGIVPPTDLTDLVRKMHEVKRFDNKAYPSGVIVDSLHSHVYRMVALARDLNISESLLAGVERTIWDHDTPETVTGDVTALEKHQHPEIMEDLRRREEEFIRTWLATADQELIWDYNAAGDYLRGLSDDRSRLTNAAILAKVIDVVDGHICYHKCLSEWTTWDRKFHPRRMPKPENLLIGLRANRKFLRRLQALPDSQSAVPIALLELTAHTVRWLWLENDRLYIPPVVEEFIHIHEPGEVPPGLFRR